MKRASESRRAVAAPYAKLTHPDAIALLFLAAIVAGVI
jgi:hypothetical protein